MEAIFLVIVALVIAFTSPTDNPTDNRIVNLGGQEIESAILSYNDTTDADVALKRSVGNLGRYKNIGYDYEFLRRNPRIILDHERKKGLRWYTKNGYDFIYMESEKTNKFVRYLEVTNEST